MDIKEALAEICREQIPKSINGVRTKCYITEQSQFFDIPLTDPDLKITLLPADIRIEKIGVTCRISKRKFEGRNIQHDDMVYKFLRKEIQDLLSFYIRNIISYFNGEVVEVIKYSEEELI